MTIELLRLKNFRNFSFSELEFSPGLNIIHGSNAAGKTSLLEAIHFLARTKSFRTHKTRELIKKNSDSFTLFSKIAGRDDLPVPLGVGYKDNKVTVRLDSQKIHRLSQIAHVLPIQTLSGNLHQIIEQGPIFRRQFIDWSLFHVKHDYIQIWKHYRKALKQRNASLRTGSTDKELSYWENVLVVHGKALSDQRVSYLNHIQKYFINIIKSLLSEEMICTLQYKSGIPKATNHQDILIKQRSNDRLKGYTSYGPHRADIAFMGAEGTNIFPTLSRGQQKLLVISLQLAHTRYAASIIETQPHFLLDDLGAELDIEHQNKVLKEVVKTNAQTFITSLDCRCYQMAEETCVFHVEHGQINKVL
ncbi:MAG: DNA replication/repair protein RecF [Methylococcaceae bacterium]